MASEQILLMKKSRSLKISDRGFMAAEWSVGVALLLFPAFVFVMTVIQIPARQSLSQAAASAAARAYVQALDQSQAETAARAAALAAVQDEYPLATPTDISFSSSTTFYCPGNEVTVEIGIKAPVVLNPFNGYNSVSSGILIHSNATERIPDYAELADSETGYSSNTNFYDYENGRCTP